jgi:hypothetical protein
LAAFSKVDLRVTRYIPEAAERSTFVLIAALIFGALCFFWQPIPAIDRQVESPLGGGVLWAIPVMTACHLLLVAGRSLL